MTSGMERTVNANVRRRKRKMTDRKLSNVTCEGSAGRDQEDVSGRAGAVALRGGGLG
jgi:hypothetical protein